MSDPKQQQNQRTDPAQDSPGEEKDKKAPEKRPDAEWGERIQTGKDIARGGKTNGPVPGATEEKK